MLCKAKTKIIFSIVAISLAFFSINPVLATNISGTGLDTTAGEAFGSAIPFSGGTSPATIIGQVVGALLTFTGVVFFILMIYGGFLWMTARGNEQQVEKAKDLITAAIVGLIIVISAYAITAFIGEAITSTP